MTVVLSLYFHLSADIIRFVGRESQRYDGLDSFRHETIKWDENEIDYAHKSDGKRISSL